MPSRLTPPPNYLWEIHDPRSAVRVFSWLIITFQIRYSKSYHTDLKNNCCFIRICLLSNYTNCTLIKYIKIGAIIEDVFLLLPGWRIFPFKIAHLSFGLHVNYPTLLRSVGEWICERVQTPQVRGHLWIGIINCWSMHAHFSLLACV